MRAVTLLDHGGPEVMSVGEVADPEARAGELLIDVVAAGVNRADLMQREGHYPPPAGASPILGLECSGRVAALGPGVRSYAVGDEVCALLDGGGYAERVVVAEGQVLPRPAGLELEAAAGLPEAICTVWSNLVLLGHLRAGETLLVHGGASGVGTTAIQVGRALDASVLVTVGSADKAARCLALGADAAFVYTEDDFVDRVRAHTDGHGADVVLDIIGAAYLERNVDVLATGGRLVIVGLQKGRRAELDLGKLLTKRAAVLATSLRKRPPAEKATIVRSVTDHAWPLVSAGQLHPVIDRVLPLDRATEAHRIMEASGHVGKLLLRP